MVLLWITHYQVTNDLTWWHKTVPKPISTATKQVKHLMIVELCLLYNFVRVCKVWNKYKLVWNFQGNNNPPVSQTHPIPLSRSIGSFFVWIKNLLWNEMGASTTHSKTLSRDHREENFYENPIATWHEVVRSCPWKSE